MKSRILFALCSTLLGIVVFVHATNALAQIENALTPTQVDATALFAVNSITDATDANLGDGICETALGNGICTLRAAIMETNALSGTDTIILPNGIYILTIAGINENLAASGDLDITDNLTIEGSDQIQTVIDGNGLDRLIHTFSANVEISNLTIQHGFVPSDWAGGIYVEPTGNISLNHVTVFNNQGAGGIYNEGDLSIFASEIISNTQWGLFNRGIALLRFTNIQDNQGVGVDNQLDPYASILEITDSSILSNTLGGIHNAGEFVISNSTISYNTDPSAGGSGISNEGSSASITNVTISHNVNFGSSVVTSGGGIVHLNRNPMYITNSTIVSNTAETVGGIYNHPWLDGDIIIQNTIIAFNSGSNCNSPIVSSGHNLEDRNDCSFTSIGDMINTDPQVGALQDNGGFLFTHALLSSSPAIDTGSNNGCPLKDQRGFLRPVDGDDNGSVVCDIGAYELGAVPFSDFTFLPLVMK